MAGRSPHYSHRSKGRRPVVVICLLLSLIALGTAIYHQQSIWILLPFSFAALTCIYAIVWNPIYGLDIDETTLGITTPSGRREILLIAIDRVSIESWTDSIDVDIHLSDGQRVSISSLAYGDTTSLRNALAAHAIPIFMK